MKNDIRYISFLKSLTALQHPLYQDMDIHLNASHEVLVRLKDINITDLMLKVEIYVDFMNVL